MLRELCGAMPGCVVSKRGAMPGCVASKRGAMLACIASKRGATHQGSIANKREAMLVEH